MKLKDRVLIIKRAILIALKPHLTQATILWVNKENIQTHTIYEDGVDPTKAPFLYFSYVAGNSKDFETLTRRTCYLLNKIAVAYTLHNKVPLSSIRYTPEPFQIAEVKEIPND